MEIPSTIKCFQLGSVSNLMTIRTVARSTDLYTAVLNIVCYHWFAIYSCLSGINYPELGQDDRSGRPGLGSIMPEAELLKLMICFYVKSTRSKVHIQSAYLIGHIIRARRTVSSAWPCLVRTAINHLITYIYYCLTFYFQTSCK